MTLTNIEAARAANRLPKACPNCERLTLFVLEARASGSATRRRKECAKCGYRLTTYEITQDEYRGLMGKRKPKSKPGPRPRPRKLKSESEPRPRPRKLNCTSCRFWNELRLIQDGMCCDMGFPEAGGWFADECSCYQERTK